MPKTTKPSTTNNVHELKRTPIDAAFDGFARAQDELLAAMNVPSKKRIIVSAISGLIAYASVYYGTASMVNTLMLGTVLLTGSAFLTFVVGFIGYVIAFVTAIAAGIKVFSYVATVNVSDVKAKFTETKQRVLGFFKRSEVNHA